MVDKQDGDEEDPMERERAEDAIWKRIQRNTFTRWAEFTQSLIDRSTAKMIDLMIYPPQY